MFSAIRTIYYGDSQGRAMFDLPYTLEETQILEQLYGAMDEKSARHLEWEIGVYVTEQQEEAFRQGLHLGFHLAQELAEEDGYSSS